MLKFILNKLCDRRPFWTVFWFGQPLATFIRDEPGKGDNVTIWIGGVEIYICIREA